MPGGATIGAEARSAARRTSSHPSGCVRRSGTLSRACSTKGRSP